jgi:hypothetical protein
LCEAAEKHTIQTHKISSCNLFILSELKGFIFIANEMKNGQKSKERQVFLEKEKYVPLEHTSP